MFLWNHHSNSAPCFFLLPNRCDLDCGRRLVRDTGEAFTLLLKTFCLFKHHFTLHNFTHQRWSKEKKAGSEIIRCNYRFLHIEKQGRKSGQLATRSQTAETICCTWPLEDSGFESPKLQGCAAWCLIPQHTLAKSYVIHDTSSQSWIGGKRGT